MYNNDRTNPLGSGRSNQCIRNNNRDHRKKGGNGNGGNNNPNGNNAEENPYAKYYRKGNLGLLYTRLYYSGIDEKVYNEQKISINIPNKTKPEKTDYQTLYYASRNKNIILQAKNAVLPQEGLIPKSDQLPMTTTYPGLLTGIGIPHGTGHKNEAKLGLAFDHTTGLPYIPGSSVKGLLRSAFPLQDEALAAKCDKKADDLDKKADDLDKKDEHDKATALRLQTNALRLQANALRLQADKKRELIASLAGDSLPVGCVDDLEKSVFDGTEIDKKTGEQCSVPVRDIFFDAFPAAMEQNGLLGLDFITPHNDNEFKEPKPLQFMRIEPGVTFNFEFRLRDSLKCGNILFDATKKKELFRSILALIGIGAKTNVGYGQLKDSPDKK